jgi:hypothetical protein
MLTRFQILRERSVVLRMRTTLTKIRGKGKFPEGKILDPAQGDQDDTT